VPHPALSPYPLTLTAARFAPRAVYVLGAAAVLAIGGGVAPWALAARLLWSAAAGLLALAAAIWILSWRRAAGRAQLFQAVSRFVERDASPSFTTDAEGVIGYQNRAAQERFGERDGATLVAVLGDYFAAPAAVLHRLQSQASVKGSAREDVVMRRGHIRLSVHEIGRDGFLWRLEDIAERTGAGRGGEGISLPMLTVSKSGTVLFMNEAMRRLIGGRESALDRIITDLPLRPGDVHEVAALSGRVRSTVLQIESAAGRSEIYLLPVLADRAIAAGWQFFDALPVPMLKLAGDGTVQMANRLARDLLGHPAPPATPLSDLLEGLGRSISDWMADAVGGHGLNRAELVRARTPAQDVFLQITLGRIADEDETTLVAVLHDATELKTLEAQFVQSQKMQAIGQLAGGVAHDFNNLLTAISGHCDLLLLRHDEGDPEYGDLVQIHQNANRAASLVGQLLAFSRKQNLHPQPLDLRETLSDLTHLLNRLVGEKVSLSLVHDPALMMVRADKRQLEQVLMNLVVNARDAMPEGGRITIETRMEHIDTPLRRNRAEVPAGAYVVVRVEDEGVGIPADQLPKIFEPFFTTKKTGEGTGLGLSTAYGIVKQTGGFIFADSLVGQGTSFTLYFPAHERVDAAPAEAAVPAPRPATPFKGDGVILLVEDEAPVRAFASRALRMRGYTVLEAENAEEALKTLENDTLSVDIFVTDVIMPGMDGPSWVKKALETRPGTRVVFVSGYAEDSLAESQARIPHSVFLPKPFSLSQLTETVQAQLH
jgi:two-component system cell cycle sensor histidine kinase/response regulator CckA